MSRIRIYLDEDAMDDDLVQALRSRNIDSMNFGDVVRASCLLEDYIK